MALSALARVAASPATGQAAHDLRQPLKTAPIETICQMIAPCTAVAFTEPTDPKATPIRRRPGRRRDHEIPDLRDTPTSTQGDIPRRRTSTGLTRWTTSSALASAVGTGPTVTIQHTEEPEIAPRSPGRLPVKKGQQLAIDGTDVEANYSQNGDTVQLRLRAAAGRRQRRPRLAGIGMSELLVQATIEPDADGDGFGDEIQDQCPTQKTTQGPCDITPPGVNGLGVSNGDGLLLALRGLDGQPPAREKGPGPQGRRQVRRADRATRPKELLARFKPIGATFSGRGREPTR